MFLCRSFIYKRAGIFGTCTETSVHYISRSFPANFYRSKHHLVLWSRHVHHPDGFLCTRYGSQVGSAEVHPGTRTCAFCHVCTCIHTHTHTHTHMDTANRKYIDKHWVQYTSKIHTCNSRPCGSKGRGHFLVIKEHVTFKTAPLRTNY